MLLLNISNQIIYMPTSSLLLPFSHLPQIYRISAHPIAINIASFSTHKHSYRSTPSASTKHISQVTEFIHPLQFDIMVDLPQQLVCVSSFSGPLLSLKHLHPHSRVCLLRVMGEHVCCFLMLFRQWRNWIPNGLCEFIEESGQVKQCGQLGRLVEAQK